VLVEPIRCKARANRPSLYSAVMHRRAPLLALAGALIVAGCVNQDLPDTCHADEATIELAVSASAMEPNDPAACRDQRVTMVIRPEIDGVFHVHGLDAVVPAATMTAGETLTLEFTADRSGQFPVEVHLTDDPQGVTIGIFTVHER
jgi:hypothetical protein